VNRRIVRDRTIAHAIQQAYSIATIKERSPEVHLFIEIGPDRVDVNVHPTKAEVRFLDQGLVHEILRRAVTDALGATSAPELILRTASALDAGGAPAPALPLGFGGAAGSAGGDAGRRGPAASRHRPGSGRGGARVARLADPRAATTAGREAVRHSSGRWRRWGSFATPSSSPWTTTGWRSSISMSRTSGSCSSRSRSG
jgi:hypothetical protein